jgi:tartrate dehydrogenase/decarboxylase / D-malate dehydrogenase
MAVHQIAVIGGDGIGPEVIDHAIRVAQKAAVKFDNSELKWNKLPWSTNYYKQHGRMMPVDGWKILADHEAILFGAVGSPDVPDKITVNELLLPMRRIYDQFVNLRPSYLYHGVNCPLKDKAPGSIDIVVYRENTEGEYAPVGGQLYANMETEIAVQTGVFTRKGCERILRAAFEGARGRRKKLTSITKSNAQIYSMGLWDDVFNHVRKDYPDVESAPLLVDAAAMDLVRKPETFDIIVASNLFGDILTDLAAAVTGSIGLASSANINPTKKYPSMFEPVHGSAPDIAEKGIANPLAAILSAALMLDHLGLKFGAKMIRESVAEVLKAGRVRTPDLGGTHTTNDMGDAVLAAL